FYPPNYLVSVDEVSKDNRTYARLWGRAEKGKRVEVQAPFVRGRRLSMLAGLALEKGIIASMVVEGSFNHDLFVQFLREDLLLTMNPYPAPCSVIIIDNACIHHSQEVLDLVEDRDSAGIGVEWDRG
ncbi:hypothetical protein BT96DRAFT_820492, partial [Gymnopus androsaceus JB14]